MKFLPCSIKEINEVLKTLIESIKNLDCIKSVDLVDTTIFISVNFDRYDVIKSCIDRVFQIKDIVDPLDCLYNYCIKLNIVEEDDNGNQI